MREALLAMQCLYECCCGRVPLLVCGRGGWEGERGGTDRVGGIFPTMKENPPR